MTYPTITKHLCPPISNSYSFPAAQVLTRELCTIANYAAALRAWHILHELNWNIKELEYKTILEGVNKLTQGSIIQTSQMCPIHS
jgi:hypothetical protein